MARPKGSVAKCLAGRTFHRLTVLCRAENRGTRAFWTCQCVCGAQKEVSSSDLVTGHIKSCGCLNAEVRKQKATRHGYNRSPTYVAWCNMRARCNNPKNKRFSSYGGRGIAVCERWATFDNFLADMGPKPDGKTLERVDVDGDYEPSNCVWADWETQHNNKRGTVVVYVDGSPMSMSQAAKTLGVTPGRVRWAVQTRGQAWLSWVRAAAAIGEGM